MVPIPPTILLVEDDTDDAVLIELALQRARLACQVHRVSTAESARDYLERRGMYRDYPLPILIITDLTLDRGGDSGLDFLKWLRESRFGSIPVVAVTGSEHPANIAEARNLVLACLRKTPLFEDLAGLAQRIVEDDLGGGS